MASVTESALVPEPGLASVQVQASVWVPALALALESEQVTGQELAPGWG